IFPVYSVNDLPGCSQGSFLRLHGHTTVTTGSCQGLSAMVTNSLTAFLASVEAFSSYAIVGPYSTHGSPYVKSCLVLTLMIMPSCPSASWHCLVVCAFSSFTGVLYARPSNTCPAPAYSVNWTSLPFAFSRST